MVVAIRSAADVGTSVSGQRLCVAYVLLSFLGFDKMNVGLGIVVAIGALFSMEEYMFFFGLLLMQIGRNRHA